MKTDLLKSIDYRGSTNKTKVKIKNITIIIFYSLLYHDDDKCMQRVVQLFL